MLYRNRLVSCILCLVTCVLLGIPSLWGQGTKSEGKAEWSIQNGQEVITVKGKINLPEGSWLMVKLWAGIACPKGDRLELLDQAGVMLQKNGGWNIQFTNPRCYFVPEYYEIEVLKESRSNRDISKPSPVLDYYYVDILSTRLIERRIKSAAVLQEIISNLYELNKILKQNIESIEQVKEVGGKFERMIKDAIIPKEQAIRKLAQQWSQWENDWLAKLEQINVQEEKSLLDTNEQIHNFLQELRLFYFQYRSEIKGEKTNLISNLARPSTFDWRKDPDETRTELQRLLENELIYKALKDIVTWVEEIVHTYRTQQQAGKHTPPEDWSERKGRAWDYFERTKQEFFRYTRGGLFQQKDAEGKTVKTSDYKQILHLLNLAEDLIKKCSTALAEPDNKTTHYEIIKLADSVMLATETLFDRVSYAR